MRQSGRCRAEAVRTQQRWSPGLTRTLQPHTYLLVSHTFSLSLSSHTNRYFSDIALHGLEVLQLVTLSPLPRRAVTAAAAGNSSGSIGSGRGAGGARSGMAILLHAASTGNAQPFYGLADPEVC